MKKVKFILVALVTMFTTTAMAQATYTDAENNKYEFQKHWFLNLQGGAQYTLGEAKFKDLISPNVQLGLGYQFSPVFGMRLQANAWQSKGGSTVWGNEYKWKYKYVAPTLDATINLTNLFGGFNAKRLCDVTFFAGVGANIAFSNDEAADANAAIMAVDPTARLRYLWDGTKPRFVGQAGVDVDFNISKRVALGIEVSANTLSDHYNSKKAGNSDWYFNGLVGVKFNLGKSTKEVEKKIDCPPAETKIIERIVEKPVEKVVYKEPETAKAAETLRRDIFFTINSTRIVAKEMTKVDDIANFLKANPNAKVSITGYADKGTGNATINRSLSQRRAAVVVRTLKEKYGISESRITSDFKGDTEQPFAENNKNRVSICIAQ